VKRLRDPNKNVEAQLENEPAALQRVSNNDKMNYTVNNKIKFRVPSSFSSLSSINYLLGHSASRLSLNIYLNIFP